MNWFVKCIVLCGITCVCYSENDTFRPTKEWQEIKPGQSIPAGLHVRLNLESGRKEAKLLEKNEENEDSKPSYDSKTSLVFTDPEEYSEEDLDAKDNKNTKLVSETMQVVPKKTLDIEFNADKFEKIKKDYKSYDELKLSLKDVNMNIKSDADIISELIKVYQNVTNEKNRLLEVVRILDTFNYLVHQIDNALWFLEENGLDVVLLPNILVFNTNTVLRVKSMRILGALTQNNPKAQIIAYEKNVGNYLSQILVSSVSTDELSTAVYAFGSLLRKFPYAQKNILPRFGMKSLITVLSKDCEVKIKAKVLTLISDLIVEKDLAITNRGVQDASQYLELDFEEWLLMNEFCQTADAVVLQKMHDLIDQPDITEYFVQSLDITAHICQQFWSRSAQLLLTLLTIKNRYIDSKEEYSLDVAKLIEKLIASLFKSTAELKDEL